MNMGLQWINPFTTLRCQPLLHPNFDLLFSSFFLNVFTVLLTMRQPLAHCAFLHHWFLELAMQLPIQTWAHSLKPEPTSASSIKPEVIDNHSNSVLLSRIPDHLYLMPIRLCMVLVYPLWNTSDQTVFP